MTDVRKLHDSTGAARFLSGDGKLISAGTLANWRVKGRGPRYAKIGGRVLYDEADLISFVESCKRSSTSDHDQAA